MVPDQVEYGTDRLLSLGTENPACDNIESVEYLEERNKRHNVGRQFDYNRVRVKQVCPVVLEDEEDRAARGVRMSAGYAEDAHLRIRPMKRVIYKDTLHEIQAFLGSRAPRRLPILDKCSTCSTKESRGSRTGQRLRR